MPNQHLEPDDPTRWEPARWGGKLRSKKGTPPDPFPMNRSKVREPNAKSTKAHPFDYDLGE